MQSKPFVMADTDDTHSVHTMRGRAAIGEAIDQAIAVRSGSSLQSGGRLMFGTPRKGKCRDLKVDGLRLK